MATTDVLILNLTARTKAALVVARILTPLVAIGVLSAERATAIAMRFVRVTVTPAAQ